MRSIYNNNLAAAIKARQDFLESLSGDRRKQASAIQKMISTKLKSAGSVNNRLVLMQQMMLDSLMELESELKKLKDRLTECKKEGKKLQEERHPNIK